MKLIKLITRHKARNREKDIIRYADLNTTSAQEIENLDKANSNFIKEKKDFAINEDKRIIEEKKLSLIAEEKAEKSLKRIESQSEWEKLRQKLYRNIYNIECPLIQEKNTEFRNALERWNSYRDENKMQILNTTDLENKFWNFAKADKDLLEVFARGIMWYKSSEIQSFNPSVSDALHYYQKSYPISDYDIDRFANSLEITHACPGG